MVKLIIFLLSVLVSGCGEAFGDMECFNVGCDAVVVEESKEEDKAEIETDGIEETDKKEKEVTEAAEIEESTDKNEEKDNADEVTGVDNKDKDNAGEVMTGVDNDNKNNSGGIMSDSSHKENQKLSSDKKNKKSKDANAIAKYNPDRVVKLAITKCKAGGMITTEQDLKKKLKAGKITKEEYDEYYPLGGMEESYYSVFVNVDLNKATTISGERLKSEEEIASHIAGMMLLETDKLFNITYAGIYKTKENEFYEFRCHR